MIEFKYEFKDQFNYLQSKVVVECNADTLSDVMQEFRHFLLAIGYCPETVDDYIEAE